MTDFNDFVVAATAASTDVIVPGVVDGATPTRKLTITAAAQAVLDDASLAAILATLGPINHDAFWSVVEEFMGGSTTSGNMGTTGLRGTGTSAGLAAEANHPGIFRWTPTNGASSVEFLALTAMGASLGTQVFDDVDGFIGIARFNATANGDHRIGVINGTVGSTATSGVYLEHLAADTNWFACCRSAAGANITRVDTGVAFGTGWVKVKARRGATGWIFNVNGGADLAEIITNLPPAATAGCIAVQLVKGATAQPTVDVDLLAMWGAVAR